MKIAQILQFSGVVAGAALAVWPTAAGALQTAGSRGSQDPPPSYPGYTLVWSDEFNRDGRPDPKNWTYERGFVRNQELQWYQPENARVEGGLLVIEARRERVPNPAFKPSRQLRPARSWRSSREFADYTSASLMTRGLHSWQYGRFEMRGRIDTRAGLWPACWTLGVTRPWPHNGEIDIMEYYRGTLLANAAWGGAERWRAIWDDSRTPIAVVRQGWPAAFHVWRMDWDERAISLSVDGQLLNEIDLDEDHQPGRHRHQPVPSAALFARQPRRSAAPRAATRRRRRSRRDSRSTTCGCIRASRTSKKAPAAAASERSESSRMRVRAFSRRGARTRDAAGAGGGAPAR